MNETWNLAKQQLASVWPNNSDSSAEFKKIIGGGWDTIIGRQVPQPGTIKSIAHHGEKRAEYRISTFLLENAEHGEQVPAVLLMPSKPAVRTAIWVNRTGNKSMFIGDEVSPAIEELLHAGVAVLGIDLYGQGAFTRDGKPVAVQRYHAGNDRSHTATFSGYMYGYNDPLFCQRVHDVLTAIAFVRDSQASKPIDLIGLDGAGHWVAAARAQAGELVDRIVIDPAGFKFEDVTSLVHADFVPGSVKYYGLPGLLALGAPGDTCVLMSDNDDQWRLVRDAFRAADAAGRLEIITAPAASRSSAGIKWLLSTEDAIEQPAYESLPLSY